MARDIEEFLRKAAERRQQQKQAEGRSPSSSESYQPEPPLRGSPPKKLVVVDDVEIVDAQPASLDRSTRPRQESIAEHVNRYMDTSEIKNKLQNLGSQVGQIREEFEHAVHKNLDHDICTVDDNREPLAFASSLAPGRMNAAQLRQMLSNPETVGQAILIAEILNRPKFLEE